MKAKAVSALRSKRGLRRVCGAEPQADGGDMIGKHHLINHEPPIN
jgi:hypothetical protein